MATVYIALGSNVGDRLENLRRAVESLALDLDQLQASPVYETDPVGYDDQERFLNAVVRGETDLSPHRLLERVQEIETQLGRERPFPNAPRTIDLDILLYDDRILDSSDLTIPHPRLHERLFVLIPLADVAPEAAHPVLGKSINDLLRALGKPTDIARIDESIEPTNGRASDWTY